MALCFASKLEINSCSMPFIKYPQSTDITGE